MRGVGRQDINTKNNNMGHTAGRGMAGRKDTRRKRISLKETSRAADSGMHGSRQKVSGQSSGVTRTSSAGKRSFCGAESGGAGGADCEKGCFGCCLLL